jgi:hypothetical protein
VHLFRILGDAVKRTALRAEKRSAERQAQLWEELITAAIYHTNRLERRALTFDEAKAVIDEYGQRKKGASADG